MAPTQTKQSNATRRPQNLKGMSTLFYLQTGFMQRIRRILLMALGAILHFSFMCRHGSDWLIVLIGFRDVGLGCHT